MEGNNPLGYRVFSLKLLRGLAENGLGQLDLLAKLCLLGRMIRRDRAAIERLGGSPTPGVFGQLGHFLKVFLPFSLHSLGLALAV